MQFSGTDPHNQPWVTNTGSAYDLDQREAMLFYTSLPNADPLVKAAILNKISSQAASNSGLQFDWDASLSAYRSYLPTHGYHWGSNKVVGGLGVHLANLVKYNINPDKQDDYKKRAVNMLHYFHGQNPMNMTFLTNMGRYGGDNSPMCMSHHWFLATRLSLKYFLVFSSTS